MKTFGKKRLLLVIFFQLFKTGIGNSPEKICKPETYNHFGVGLSCYDYNEIPTKEVDTIAHVLDLNDKSNVLERLPTQGFRSAGFTNLKALYLENCQIREIENGAFSGGEKLTHLYLHRNKIEVLNPSVFQGLTSLAILYLNQNPLRTFQGEFPRLLQLTELRMADCHISSIEPDLFKNLENLEQLDLDRNQLVTQDLEAVAPLKHLKLVWLDNNRIENLNPNVFKHLAQIQAIWMNENPLKFPIDAEFPELLNMTILELKNCNLSSIQPNLFRNLQNLKIINLDTNYLENNALEGLSTLKKLQHLSIKGNKLTNFNPNWFSGMEYLKFIFLNNNPIREFEEDAEFPVLRSLTHLNFDNCHLTSTNPNLFRNLGNLQMISFTNNSLTAKDMKALSSLRALQNLWVDGNNLKIMSLGSFQSLNALQNLYLDSNPSLEFTEDMRFPKSLLDLRIRQCQLTSLPKNLFQGLNNLVELSISENQLSSLHPQTFQSLTSLKKLWLSNNKFKTFDKLLFKNLRTLRMLDLDNCGIQSVPKNLFQDLENLRLLSLIDNHLTTLDWKELVFMKKLKTIMLANNPWNCSCGTVSLLNFLQNKSIEIKGDEQLSPCQYTSELVGKNKTLLMETLLQGSSKGGRKVDGLLCSPGSISLSAYYPIIDLPEENAEINATLQCEFNGFPPGNVHWKKNGEDLEITERIIKFPTKNLEPESDYDFRQEILVEGFDAGDVGEYECLVSNPAGASIQKTFVNPEILGIDIKRPNASLSAMENNDTEHVTLKCVYGGVPRPKVKWVIPNFIHFQNESGHVELNPKGIWYQTRVILKGIYRSFNATCHVRNYLGQDEATITIEETEQVLLNEMQSDTKMVWVLALVAAAAFIAIIFIFLIKLQSQKSDKLLPHEISGFFTGSKSRDSPDYVKLPYDSNTYEIPKSQFQIHEDDPLGSGAFGSVVKGTIVKESANGNRTMSVAVKMTKNDCDPNEIKGLLSELKLLPYLGNSHPNIVKLMGAYTKQLKNGKLYCFLELCSLGSLQGYLRKLSTNQRETSEFGSGSEESIELGTINFATSIRQDLLRWSKEIATALEFIASRNIVHADIATRNVLLTSNKTAKVSDFGLSRRLYQYQSYVSKNQVPLPWKWMSPEALRNVEFTEKSDVWSFGVTLWEIWSLGDDPFPGLAFDVNFPTNLEKGFSPGIPRIQQNGIFSVMNRCWTVSPESRPTFAEVKELLQGVGADAGPSCSGNKNINAEVTYENLRQDVVTSTTLAVMNPGYI